LNAGQVGAIRAGRYISHRYTGSPPALDEFQMVVESQAAEHLEFCRRTLSQSGSSDPLSVTSVLTEIQDRMSGCAAHVRDPSAVTTAVADAWNMYQRVCADLRVSQQRKLPLAFRAADLCLTHAVYLEAIAAYLDAGGGSRGSVFVRDAAGEPVGAGLEDHWRMLRHASDAVVERQILEVRYRGVGSVNKTWVNVRPVPESDGSFEQVWAEYRNGGIFTHPEED
jgi:hypothetical protein